MVLALIAIALSIYYYLQRKYDYFEKRGIPHKKPLPLLGNTWKAMFKFETWAQMYTELYNINRDAKYVGFYEFMLPIILIRDVELAKQIMVKHFDHFKDHRTAQNDDAGIVFSKNLFALRGERWKEVRNVLSPVFTSSKMKSMFKLMSECAERYGNILSNLTEKERVLDLKEILTRYTNDTIATCAFGIPLDTMADPKNKFYLYGREVSTFGTLTLLKFLLVQQAPRLSRMLGVKIVRPEIEDFYIDLVAGTIKARKEKGIYRPDLLQLLMEASDKLGPGKELTIEDMAANATVFLSGGLENIANLVCFAAYEIALTKRVQERLQNEIDGVLEQCNGEVTYEAINEMNFLNAVLHETMRMYPIAIQTDRVCTKRFELPPPLPGAKPVVVEEGTCLQIPIYPIQHDPQYFDNPNTFNPDRYVGDFRKVQNASTFLIFGQGPRVCIANRFVMVEAKVFLFHLFANCTLKSCSKTVVPMKLKKTFTLLSENGIWFELMPREKPRMVYMESVSGGGVHA